MRKVEAAGFPDDNEPLWSTNFKRSIASLMQVELRSVGEAAGGVDNQIYIDQEVIWPRLISFHFSSSIFYSLIVFFILKCNPVIAVWRMQRQLLLVLPW